MVGKWACSHVGKTLGQEEGKKMGEEAEGRQGETQGDTVIYFRTKGLLI